MIRCRKINVCVPGERGVSSVIGVVVWGDDLPSDDVVACQQVDVAFSGVVGGERDPVKVVD